MHMREIIIELNWHCGRQLLVTTCIANMQASASSDEALSIRAMESNGRSANKFNISYYSPPSTVYACNASHATDIPEPFTYNQAITDPRWIEAMDKELNALQTNNT